MGRRGIQRGEGWGMGVYVDVKDRWGGGVGGAAGSGGGKARWIPWKPPNGAEVVRGRAPVEDGTWAGEGGSVNCEGARIWHSCGGGVVGGVCRMGFWGSAAHRIGREGIGSWGDGRVG